MFIRTNAMSRTLPLLLLVCLLIPSTFLLTSQQTNLPYCQLESYTEKFSLLNCSNTPISIKSTRCRGQCYSEDLLVYDWQSEPRYHRHQQRIHCCFPKQSHSQAREIHCENHQQKRTIHYERITQCACKLCHDRCSK